MLFLTSQLPQHLFWKVVWGCVRHGYRAKLEFLPQQAILWAHPRWKDSLVNTGGCLSPGLLSLSSILGFCLHYFASGLYPGYSVVTLCQIILELLLCFGNLPPKASVLEACSPALWGKWWDLKEMGLSVRCWVSVNILLKRTVGPWSHPFPLLTPGHWMNGFALPYTASRFDIPGLRQQGWSVSRLRPLS